MAYDPLKDQDFYVIQGQEPDWEDDDDRWPLWKTTALVVAAGLMCWSAFSWILIEVLL